MNLEQLNTLLTSISGFSNKVAYYAFPTGEAPPLPFICFYERGYDSMPADGINFYSAKEINVELYTELKSPAIEELVETALTNSDIYWEKTEEYLDSEKCWMITYEIEV